MSESAIVYEKANGVDRVPMRASDGEGPVPWWLVVGDPFAAEGGEAAAESSSGNGDEHGQPEALEVPPETLAATRRAPAPFAATKAPAASPSRRPTGAGWSDELAQWALGLEAQALPKRFMLRQGCVVVDRVKFLAGLQADVRRGPSGPRARFGALQADLESLRALLARGE